MPQFNLIEVLIIQGASVVAVIVGFYMGWRAKRPDAKVIDRPHNPGPTDIEYEDPWREALTEPKDDGKEGATSTL